jgi:DNA-binding transcriptional ArsR family regulator
MVVQAGFAEVAAACADPVREAMLAALADGRALPAGELAAIAGISPQSASAHLQRLVHAGLLTVWSQGRFRYYRIIDEQVAEAIEALANLAARSKGRSSYTRTLPLDICFARRCYNHLAGWLGVALTDAMQCQGLVRLIDNAPQLTDRGARWLADHGVPLEAGYGTQPALRFCLDWTERRPHLAGRIPTLLLRHLLANGYLLPGARRRTLQLTKPGLAWFAELGVRPSRSEVDRLAGGLR